MSAGFPSVRNGLPPSVAVTLVIVPCCHLSYIPYVFIHCDLQVLKIPISNQCHEKKLKIKENSFIKCHSKALVMKVK